LKRTLYLILFLVYAAQGIAQVTSSPFNPVRRLQQAVIDFTVDHLGNVYTISRDNQLIKYNSNGDSIAVYNDVRKYGKIFSLDATNPLKLLLYHRDFSTIVILDRFLNVRNTIDLRRKNIFQVKAIGQSYDNGIWIYDEQDAKLKKLNDEGELMSESADFRLFMQDIPSPVQIIDEDRLVHIYDPKKGLFVFDYYGTLKNKVALLGWEDIQVVKGVVYGRKLFTLQQYQPGTLSLKEQPLQHILAGVSKMQISLNNFYTLKDGIISVYSF
jgi:hypothetical protein